MRIVADQATIDEKKGMVQKDVWMPDMRNEIIHSQQDHDNRENDRCSKKD